jgi:methylisocitrate lyase
VAADLLAALEHERPVQIAGVINAYTAMLAERAGFRALYLSGSGVATASFGLPDLALTSLTEVAEETRRISGVTDLPILVDADTGWGGPMMVERTVIELGRAGAAAVQIEDQITEKRCGHRPNKRLIDAAVMEVKIAAAAAARRDPLLRIVARTDALTVTGRPDAVERAQRYAAAGADVIFLEAAQELADYTAVRDAVSLPVLANMTEFGRTPLYTSQELAGAGVGFALYPLSAHRAMAAAALAVFEAIRADGSQRAVLDLMQTRAELYEVLDYHEWEARMDRYAELLPDSTLPT